MRVLVACEFSGTVRDAFRARGHDAMSCDILPTERPDGPHHQGDVRDVLDDDWDLMVAHPPCTYLANSGVRWLYEKEGRWDLMRQGAEFFKMLLDAPIPRIAVENPVMHKHARAIIGEGPTQTVQPYEFGTAETKRTGLWLRGLPKLVPTEIVTGPIHARVHRMAPSPDRWRERSRFYPSIAAAMAEQWDIP